MTAQTNDNSIWVIIVDRYVVFQWKNCYLPSKTGQQVVPLYLLKWKLFKIVRSCSWIHSHKELAQATRCNLASLSCSSTTRTYSGCLIKIILTCPYRHFLQALKQHLTDKQKCHIFQLLAIAKEKFVKPFFMWVSNSFFNTTCSKKQIFTDAIFHWGNEQLSRYSWLPLVAQRSWNKLINQIIAEQKCYEPGTLQISD